MFRNNIVRIAKVSSIIMNSSGEEGGKLEIIEIKGWTIDKGKYFYFIIRFLLIFVYIISLVSF